MIPLRPVLVLLGLLVLSMIDSCHSSPTIGNVLFVAVASSKSHKNFFYGLIEAIARDGSNVTVLTPYPPSRTIANVREIVIEENDLAPVMSNAFVQSSIGPVLHIMQKGPELCFKGLASPKIATVLEQDFDLAFVSMFFNECFLPHIHAKNIPFVFVNPAENSGPFSGVRMGNIAFPSFDYNPVLNHVTPLTFWQRIIVTVATLGAEIMFGYVANGMDSTGRTLGLYPPNTPHLTHIYANASLLISNSFRLAEHPRPYMPNILLAGGIHCRPATPLPKDLEDWVSSSGDAGFIYFSLGSAVRPSDIPERTMKVITSVFESLPHKVLWKYDLDAVAGGLPSNVKLTKWAPQQDLLGHRHLRLFITHGGLLSTQESTYHGVPVLGLPVFGDQDGNMQKAEAQGWGKRLLWTELTYDIFRNTILMLLQDPRMRSNAQRLGQLMKDRPMLPADEVNWWAGYLIRTGGAKHLRSGAADLPWYKLYNVDVWLLLGVTAMLLIWLQFVLLKILYRRCCGKGNNERVKRKNN